MLKSSPPSPAAGNDVAPHDSARRHFLRRSIVIVPAVALTGAQLARPGVAAPIQQTANAAASAATGQSNYSPVFFHPEEWAFISAAVARLIPSDDLGPGGIEAGVPEFIDRQMDAVFGYAAIWYMQGPFVEAKPEFGYQAALAPRDVYRAGIAGMNSYCKTSFNGKTFAELDAPNQDATLKLAEAGTLTFEGTSSKTFFGFLLQNTKEGYLSDPIHGGNKNAGSWAMIGFPGARADFADWVGRPGEKYPLPPVSINGPQG